jgi:hypothetical protein
MKARVRVCAAALKFRGDTGAHHLFLFKPGVTVSCLRPSDALERCLDSSMTEWERGREREEFARAAQLYVSSHSTLSSRFTHAKEDDDSGQVQVPRDQEVCCHHVPAW